jgi:hypothetical protein
MPKEPELPEDGPDFRREVRRVARGRLWFGFALSIGGVTGAVIVGAGDESLGGPRAVWACLAVMAIGWGFMGAAIAARTRFRRDYIASHPI